MARAIRTVGRALGKKLFRKRTTCSRIATVALLLALNGCATTVSVAPGHAAVVMAADGSMATVGEGETALGNLVAVDDVNLRVQDQTLTFSALTADGVRVLVQEAVVRYAPAPDELPELMRTVGPGFVGSLVRPVVQSIIGAVLATYRWDDLDPTNLRQAQERVIYQASAALRPYHLLVDGVELKSVVPSSPVFAAAVARTAIWQERAARARTEVEVARQHADARRQLGRGTATANAAIASSLTPAVLSARTAQAWQRLLRSPSTTLVAADPSTPLEVSP